MKERCDLIMEQRTERGYGESRQARRSTSGLENQRRPASRKLQGLKWRRENTEGRELKVCGDSSL